MMDRKSLLVLCVCALLVVDTDAVYILGKRGSSDLGARDGEVGVDTPTLQGKRTVMKELRSASGDEYIILGKKEDPALDS